jgi:uncharacterized protein RhaS with RHS repeats
LQDPQSWNAYAYTRNNPLSLIDPFGLDYCTPVEDSNGRPGYKDCVSDKEYEKDPAKHEGKVYYDHYAVTGPSVVVTLTAEERALMTLALAGEFASDPRTIVEAYKFVGATPVVAALECATEVCDEVGVALALVPGRVGRVGRIAKGQSKIWRAFKPFRGAIKRSGRGRNTRYYKWDHTHNNIEVYNSHGEHIGVMDPERGSIDFSAAVPGRNIKSELR